MGRGPNLPRDPVTKARLDRHAPRGGAQYQAWSLRRKVGRDYSFNALSWGLSFHLERSPPGNLRLPEPSSLAPLPSPLGLSRAPGPGAPTAAMQGPYSLPELPLQVQLALQAARALLRRVSLLLQAPDLPPHRLQRATASHRAGRRSLGCATDRWPFSLPAPASPGHL